MIHNLRIVNFKSIADSGDLEIRPLTFLVGPNSSGKSSVFKALLLLKQTVQSRDISNPLLVNGPYVALGAYSDFIYEQKCGNNFSISFKFEPSFPVPKEKVEGPVTIYVQFGYIAKTKQIYLQTARYVIGERAKLEIITNDRGKSYWLIRDDGGEKRIRSFINFFFPIIPDEKRPEPYFSGVFTNLMLFFFYGIFYIGPLRESPKRFYLASGERPDDVGLKGERAIEVLWQASRRKKDREKLMSSVNRWLNEFGFAVEAKLTPLGENNYSLDLKDPNIKLWVNLADVGFGASQLFPIIVEGFYSHTGAVLLIEQPEIHLHPRAQATLGDLLIDIMQKGKKTLLVETHSEHLIFRVQRRIAEGTLKNQDVAIYSFQPTPAGSKITEIKLNDLGQFETEGLPEGFFEEDYSESTAIYKAIAKRAKGQVETR